MRVLKLSEEAIYESVRVLNSGGIVCFPTDTVYGLLTSALCKECIQRLYKIRRPSGRPFLVLLPDSSWLLKLGVFASSFHLRLLNEPWLTIIFQKRGCKYGYITKGLKTIAVRIPHQSSEVFSLLKEFNKPLVAPSANLEWQKTAVSVKEAIDYFGDLIELYIDGDIRDGLSSTIIRAVGPFGFRIVRDGALPRDRIDKVVKELLKKRLRE